MVQKVEEIEKKVLNKITPDKKDRKNLKNLIQDLSNQVETEIRDKKLPAFPLLVGSTAKDTYLKNKLDVDLFLSFPTSFSKKDIAKNTLSIGRKILNNTEECYAEHPYIRGYYKDKKVEIVPCYTIENSSQKLSAVDRTPLHTKYVKEHLRESQKKDVRLFKQFLIGIGCYGAEAEIEGFSGYLCELLIMKYGSFKKLIQHVQHWKTGEKLALSDEEYPDFDTYLTFIDPVDNERNVASALSKEKFNLCVKACREYFKKPSIKFYFPNKIKPWSLEKIKETIKKQNRLYVGVVIAKPDIIDETLYPQIKKAVRSIKDTSERYEFNIHDVTYHVDDLENNVLIIIKTNKESLPENLVHKGPPVKMKKNAKEFKKKWEHHPKTIQRPYIKDGRIYVKLERDYVYIKNLLRDQVKKLSLGKHLDKSRDKGYEIIETEDLLKENLREFWTKYLDDKMPWER